MWNLSVHPFQRIHPFRFSSNFQIVITNSVKMIWFETSNIVIHLIFDSFPSTQCTITAILSVFVYKETRSIWILKTCIASNMKCWSNLLANGKINIEHAYFIKLIMCRWNEIYAVFWPFEVRWESTAPKVEKTKHMNIPEIAENETNQGAK